MGHKKTVKPSLDPDGTIPGNPDDVFDRINAELEGQVDEEPADLALEPTGDGSELGNLAEVVAAGLQQANEAIVELTRRVSELEEWANDTGDNDAGDDDQAASSPTPEEQKAWREEQKARKDKLRRAAAATK